MADEGSNTVSVIDAVNNTVTATVPVGNNPVAFGKFVGPISAQPVLPVANFSTNVTSGYAPLPVQFNNVSTNADSWYWDFGDGTNSTEQNPTHIYPEVGEPYCQPDSKQCKWYRFKVSYNQRLEC